ncbi:hypothetical protein [Paenarthrobacter nicotinovorans]|uniref:hypothetical protein n=1 Tax=Paenarthrobacter nicotinovorans TaxID=29320 RepID=UPI001642F3CB|nr:hypothetical protein [Paenarthrobacter nicotinovorans]
MNAHDRVQFDLDEDEREVLRRGLTEWAGPAAPTEAMALAMGFRDVDDLFAEGERIAAFIQAGRSLTKVDWCRALLATEIVFASNTVGAGLDWSIVTGYQDDETIRILRAIQRKLGGSRAWPGNEISTTEAPEPDTSWKKPLFPPPASWTMSLNPQLEPTAARTETGLAGRHVAGVGSMAKRQQTRRIAEGLALGVLAYGVERVPNERTALEAALNDAWKSWRRAADFVNVRGPEAAQDIWAGMEESGKRHGIIAAWENHSVPHLLPTYEDVPIPECLNRIADDKASADDWIYLGYLFLKALYESTATEPN